MHNLVARPDKLCTCSHPSSHTKVEQRPLCFSSSMLLLIYLTSVEFSVESSYAHTHNGGLRSSVRQCPDHHAHYPVHSQRDANCRLLIRLKSEILKQQSALIHIQRDESFKARQLLLHSFSAFLDVSSVFLLICHIFFCHNNLTCDRKERPDGLEYKGRTDRCH